MKKVASLLFLALLLLMFTACTKPGDGSTPAQLFVPSQSSTPQQTAEPTRPTTPRPTQSVPPASTASSQPEEVPPPEAPANLRVEDGVIRWDPVEGAYCYVIAVDCDGNGVGDADEGEALFECYYEMPTLVGNGGTYQIMLSVMKQTTDGYVSSEPARIYHQVQAPVQHGYDEKGLEYTLLEDGSGYEVAKGDYNIANGTLVIPDYFGEYPVKRIADTGFSSADNHNPGIIGLILPTYLESIGNSAFENSTSLPVVVIPDTVTEIGAYAFYNCRNLEKVVLSKALKIIGASCFEDAALAELILPDSLEIIGQRAFYVNEGEKLYVDGELVMDKHVYSNLSSVVIPASVKHIGNQAFAGREKLSNVTFRAPGNLQTIGTNIFQDTPWFDSLPDGPVYWGNIAQACLYTYKGTMPEGYVFEVPENVKVIASGALKDQKNLKKLILPKGVKLIGAENFSGCTSLTEVVLPEDLQTLPEGAFMGASSLKTILLPDTLLEIGSSAFAKSGLERIAIPSGVKVIGSSTFSRCTALTEVVFPENLEEIGKNAFSGCSALTDIALPAKLKVLGSNAFASCTSLKTIVIPSSIEKMDYPFGKTHVLTHVFFAGNAAKLQKLIENSGDYYLSLWNNLPIFCYSETAPTKEGNFWHYVDGKPTPWKSTE